MVLCAAAAVATTTAAPAAAARPRRRSRRRRRRRRYKPAMSALTRNFKAGPAQLVWPLLRLYLGAAERRAKIANDHSGQEVDWVWLGGREGLELRFVECETPIVKYDR